MSLCLLQLTAASPPTLSVCASQSYITSLCLDKFLSDTSDLVFVEFVANDGSEMDKSLTVAPKARAFERLLRQVMRRDKAPAVVMMQVRGGWAPSRFLSGSCDRPGPVGLRAGASFPTQLSQLPQHTPITQHKQQKW